MSLLLDDGNLEMADMGYNKPRFLVIEDERSMAELLRQALEDQHYHVRIAYTGAEGVALADSGDFAAIILDVLLPGVKGFNIARQLRASGNLTSIIMLTARDTLDDVILGLDSGAEDYWTKPFSFIELLPASAPRFAGAPSPCLPFSALPILRSTPKSARPPAPDAPPPSPRPNCCCC